MSRNRSGNVHLPRACFLVLFYFCETVLQVCIGVDDSHVFYLFELPVSASV